MKERKDEHGNLLKFAKDEHGEWMFDSQ